jgi:hypothetical protein
MRTRPFAERSNENLRGNLNPMQVKDQALDAVSKLILAPSLFTITVRTQVKRSLQNEISTVGSGNLVSKTLPSSGFDRIEAGAI